VSRAVFGPLIDLYREAGARAGHAPETLRSGCMPRFVGTPPARPRKITFPVRTHFNKNRRSAAGRPVTRAQFDALRGPTALSYPATQNGREKVLRVSEALGGLSARHFQMTVATLPQAKMLRAIELLGTKVARSFEGTPCKPLTSQRSSR